MANTWLNLYKGSPAPLTFTLDAAGNDVQSDTVALRCESGYCTATDTTVSAASDTANHWAFSLDGTNWSDTVIIASTVSTVNSNFFVKASATSSENPSNDSSVKIRVRTKIAAV